MARQLRLPLEPLIAPDESPIPAGLASEFRSNINARLQAIENKAQYAQGNVEAVLELVIGNGAVSGGTITHVSGLQVSVAAWEAFIGSYVKQDSSTTLTMTNNATNYIWARQDGTLTVNTTGTKPSSTDGKGDALLWGTVTTSGGTVTNISNTRRSVSFLAQSARCDAKVLFIAQNGFGGGVVEANLSANRDIYPGEAMFYVFNPQSAGLSVNLLSPVTGWNVWIRNQSSTNSLTVRDAGGSTITTISANSAVRLLYTGTAWRLF